jgi:hypothetical protein
MHAFSILSHTLVMLLLLIVIMAQQKSHVLLPFHMVVTLRIDKIGVFPLASPWGHVCRGAVVVDTTTTTTMEEEE